jgi:hypothetical protein
MVLLVADLYGHNREIDANLRIGEIELDPGAMEPSAPSDCTIDETR